MRIAFVTIASEDYFPGAMRLFESIHKHTNSNRFSSILFSNNSEAVAYFGELFNEIFLLPELPEELRSNTSVARFRFTLHKLYILEFLKKSNFDRIVFFDCDLLCCFNLNYLLELDLNKYHFLAVRDFACTNYYSQEIEELGLDSERIFNTGCFILNRKILDVLSYQDLITEISNSTKSYDGGDQGYFNFIIQNSNAKLGTLPLRFNYPLDANYPLLWWPPSLVHFSGIKPWSTEIPSPNYDKSIFSIWHKGRDNRLIGIYAHLVLVWYLRNFQIIFLRVMRQLKEALLLIFRKFIPRCWQ